MKQPKEPSFPDTYRIKQSNYEKLTQLVSKTGLSKVAIINLLIEQATVEAIEGKGQEMIEVGKPFTIKKTGRSTVWKAIPHPFFENAFALVREHQLIYMNTKNDEKYIVSGADSLEKIESQAYQHS